MPDPDKPAKPGKPSDKTLWREATRRVFEETLAGAKAGEEAYPIMEVEEVRVRWAVRPKFLEDGTLIADTDEPGTTAVELDAVYKRNRKPKLKEE